MSSDNNETRQVQIAVADPTPLGLFGLSVVTFVASMQKLGVVSDVSWVIPWALVCGSFAQLLAAYFDFLPQEYFWSINLRRIRLFLVGRSDELDD